MTGGRASRKGYEWRPIPGLPHYEISEFGDIRRTVDAPTRRAGHVVRGHVVWKQGYRAAKLAIGNGEKKVFRIHRLVVEAFLGPCPSDKDQVAHFDGIRTNNHYSNLRWATAKENSGDRVRHGRDQFTGETNPKAKLTAELVQKIRAEYSPGYGNKIALARKYQLSRTSLDYLLSKRNWSHV